MGSSEAFLHNLVHMTTPALRCILTCLFGCAHEVSASDKLTARVDHPHKHNSGSARPMSQCFDVNTLMPALQPNRSRSASGLLCKKQARLLRLCDVPCQVKSYRDQCHGIQKKKCCNTMPLLYPRPEPAIIETYTLPSSTGEEWNDHDVCTLKQARSSSCLAFES